MLKVLLKKQFAEVFKSYFYDAKKNKMRPKWAIAAYFVLFFAVMVGMLGGMFSFLAVSLCEPLTGVGMGWLYFLLMGSIAILLGAFGSVFNTFTGLYLAKDNDLLLSLPIPVRTIITARLTNVYLMGAMYSLTVLLPMLIVYWITAGVTAARVICGIAFVLIVTFIILLLSCVLGWIVAKISLRLKNKSFVSVLLALVFIGVYYFCYFKANSLIQDMVQNAQVYGEKIRGAAYFLYLFGRIGEGAWLPTVIYAAVTALLCGLVWFALSRSFLNIATAGGAVGKTRYVEKTARQKSAFAALLGKEFGRFTSSANYMLNCGLGTLLIPAVGVLLLIKGRELCELIGGFLVSRPDAPAVLVCTMFIMLASMNDMAAPSVSLEGRSLWIPQSLPVRPRTALWAKGSVQLILTGIPMLLAAICAAVAVPTSPAVRILLVLLPLAFTVFSALFGLTVGLRMPLLHWTNELAPIKQSGAVAIAMFGEWAIGAAVIGIYLLIGYRIGAALYLTIWTALFAAAALAMLRWLNTKGGRVFAEL